MFDITEEKAKEKIKKWSSGKKHSQENPSDLRENNSEAIKQKKIWTEKDNEIKRRLSQRAAEYFMFMDNE